MFRTALRATHALVGLAGLGAAWCACSAEAPGAPAAAPSGDSVQDAGIPPACVGDCETAIDAASEPRPLPTCDVKAYGARGDGHTKDTAAIQAAIDACAPTGGVVSLHDGTFLSGTVKLASSIVLDVAPTATLLGSRDIADYPDQSPPITNTQLGNCRKALVYAEGAHDVAIRGGGTIDGNARGVPAWNGSATKEATRPMAIFTTMSSRVTIENVTVKDAATWAVVNMEVDTLVVRDITVHSNLGPTHDGIDVVDGHHVLIEGATVDSGDDSICLKSGSKTGTKDVTVRNCHTTQSGVANGVKFGTASVGSFEDIVVEDTIIEHAQAAAMAVESVDGARIANVKFRRIRVDDVGTPFFVLLGSRDRDPARVGSIDGVSFDDVKGTNMRYAWGSIVTGTKIGNTTFGISNLAFSNLDLTFQGAGNPPNPAPYSVDNFPEYQGAVPNQAGKLYNQYPDAKFFTGVDGREDTSYRAPGFAFFVRHASGVTFSSCRTAASKADPRPWLATKDATGVAGSCAP